MYHLHFIYCRQKHVTVITSKQFIMLCMYIILLKLLLNVYSKQVAPATIICTVPFFPSFSQVSSTAKAVSD